MMSLSEVAADLKEQHMKFIESRYHLHHHRLIAERRSLMESGEVVSDPWVEITPSYAPGKRYKDLNLPLPVVKLFQSFHQAKLGVFDPPYAHQAKALEAFFSHGKDLVASTGTGSGKTEIFLYSILGAMVLEAERRTTTSMRGFRAIILYPMNALVSDQLARLRRLLGSDTGADELERLFGRRVQFGMYTSRTPYHGKFDTKRNDNSVKPIIDYYCKLQQEDKDLFQELKSKGRVPAKDLVNFRNRMKAKETQFRTQPKDVELFTRQEMNEPNEYGGAPDILITNYSMLEYMLLRPIEQPMFDQTRAWLAKDERNRLLIVLDEAHLYRGAQGAEVALLIRRLLQHLEIPRSRVRFILASASLGSDARAVEIAPTFASSLTAASPTDFEVITGVKEVFNGGSKGSAQVARVLESVSYDLSEARVQKLASELGWDPPGKPDELLQYLGQHLTELPVFRLLHERLGAGPVKVKDLASILFPDADGLSAFEATGNLLFLGSVAKVKDGQNLLPARLHVFFKGLPRLFTCVNPKCSKVRKQDIESPLLGRMYVEPRLRCECGARVFELLSHRTCGAAYIRAYRNQLDRDGTAVFLWTEGGDYSELEEVHILLEEPRTDPDPKNKEGLPLSHTTPYRYLDIETGHLVLSQPDEADPDRFIKVWVPGKDQKPTQLGAAWSWSRCPACGISERSWHGRTKVMDLETKGEETFANIVRTVFQHQPVILKKNKLPNKGKKILCFSDSRQKAAKLARDLQRTVELDSFREVVVATVHELPPDTPMEYLFPAIAAYTRNRRIGFFDDADKDSRPDDKGYDGSRTRFVNIQRDLEKLAERRKISIKDLVLDRFAAEDINKRRPKEYDVSVLKFLGDEHFSVSATLVGFLQPTEDLFEAIGKKNPDLDSNLLRELLLEILRLATSEQAYDNEIEVDERTRARGDPRWRRGSEGLDKEEIVPEHIKEKLKHRVSPVQWDQFIDSIVYPKKGERLFSPLKNSRYVINPKAVTLHLALEHQWFRCKGCRQFSGWKLAGTCPRDGCQGEIAPVREDELHMKARNSFLRDPCKRVVSGLHQPFTLRSEEHSAQLNTKDLSEAFSKTEQYELLFQDVLIGEAEVEQPIDVLSCTTTMEVGIDIGSLTAVAMRTVPPRPENYQQRSGRAGRRGSGLSTIITFADNSPHESYYFHKPDLLIGAEASEPVIYTGNRKIAERHVNASLIARFFDHRKIPKTADVFESLGASRDFFSGDGEYSLPEFENWLRSIVLVDGSNVPALLGSLLPEQLKEALPEYGEKWRELFVRATAEQFLGNLLSLSRNVDWQVANVEEDLLPTLLYAALLPTFSFPIDTCNFVVREIDRRDKSQRLKTSYEMTRGLKEALSDYIPGRQIVVDKKTFTSYGLYFPFSKDPVDRASVEDWTSLKWLNFCPVCETVVAEKDRNLNIEKEQCRVCRQSILESRYIYQSRAFAPEVKTSGLAEESNTREEDRIYATPAKFPIPTLDEDERGDYIREHFCKSQIGKMPNQRLMVVNFGPNSQGFSVCKKCGAVDMDHPHNRPYPRDFRVRRSWPSQCSGDPINTTFGYEFTTDLAVLRIPIKKPLNFAPRDKWFLAATKSLAEALVLGASRALGIDTNELAGGTRTLPRRPEDGPDVYGYVEFFLYDTTPGGAGFSLKANKQFEDVLRTTHSILSDCYCFSSCHSCLRTYYNRFWHKDLDRHLGLVLLEYAVSGKVPDIDDKLADSLVKQLSLTLTLMKPDVRLEQTSERPRLWTVELNKRKLRFNVRSCLVENQGNGNRKFDHSITDFSINKELPRVANELIQRLKPGS